MLLNKYDFYDVYAVITSIRSNPQADYNGEIINAVCKVLSEKQESNCIEPNIIRNALRNIKSIDKEVFHWVYVENVYTYMDRIVKDEFYYDFLLNGFNLLSFCAQNKEFDRLYDLADALHNIPIFIADECENFKKSVKAQVSSYNKKYRTDLWRELTKN
ncbi:MAG: hypothetical protein IJY56_04245 [Clostridia bacterium]|nr:hypothetical protein [Clostridia bacterium]